MKPSTVTTAVLVLGLLVPAWGSRALGSPTPAATQEVSPVNTPYLYTSDLGEFKVMMPSGCSQIRQRYNEQDTVGDEAPEIESIQIVNVFCDRSGQTGSGCSVSVYFNLTDGKGGPAGEPEMTQQVQKYLDKFGVEVIKQARVAREFPGARKAQGLDLRCRAPESPGEFWIRGLIVDGDIYILAAWNDDGGLWNDPDIVAFFDSFIPSAY